MLAFDLLQNGRLNALGENIAGQDEHRYAINRRHRRARDHVGRAGSDRGGAGKSRQAVLVLGIGDRGEHLRLLVAALVIAELGRVLLQGLANAGDVAVAEDAPHAGEEAVLVAVAGDVLIGEVFDQRLRHGESEGLLLS